jgi:hypothetical protein
MPNYRLLAVNDYSSRVTRGIAKEPNAQIYVINIEDGGYSALKNQLTQLRDKKIRFGNAAFTTHGASGGTFFGGEALNGFLDSANILREFAYKGCDTFFAPDAILRAACGLRRASWGGRYLASAPLISMYLASVQDSLFFRDDDARRLQGHGSRIFGEIRRCNYHPAFIHAKILQSASDIACQNDLCAGKADDGLEECDCSIGGIELAETLAENASDSLSVCRDVVADFGLHERQACKVILSRPRENAEPADPSAFLGHSQRSYRQAPPECMASIAWENWSRPRVVNRRSRKR